MIHLKLRQAGEVMNYRRVERLFGLEQECLEQLGEVRASVTRLSAPGD
jgi:hypothetical protein